MGSSAGRRDKRYVTTRTLYQQTRPPCWLQYPGCTGAGTTPDHDPPLSTYPPGQWQGVLRPACRHCQDTQGAHIRNRTTVSTWTW